MFKRLSSTVSTNKNTKAEVTEAPARAEPVDKAVVEEKEPVSEKRADDAQRDIIEAVDNVIAKAEESACANETVRGAMAYALAQGQEGDAIDQVFSKVEGMTCAPENELLDSKQCTITKFSKEEKVGLSIRTSLITDGLYVKAIAAGSKFEATELAVGDKVLKINGEECPAKLSDAIALLKGTESTLTVTAGLNDEAAKKIEEMGQMETEHNDLVVKKAEMTQIAVDGYADSCGFFWSLQNGLCALQDTGAKAIEAAPQPVAEAPKEEDAEAPKEEKEEATKDAEEEAKPEITDKALADEEEEAPKDKKKKKLLKKPTLPSLPSIKAPSLPSLKIKRGKSKKAVEEVVEEKEASPVETITGEDGMMTIKFTKDSLDESVGLALRNSVLNESIYIYGIFDGSKLKTSGLAENMRIHTINGEAFSNVEEAVKVIKEAAELEIVAGPNDEPEAPETPEETEEEEPKRGWFW